MKANISRPARKLRISDARMEAVMKAKRSRPCPRSPAGLRMPKLPRSRIPRSAVTGILSGSLQKVTIDRVLKLVAAVGLVAEVKVTRARAA